MKKTFAITILLIFGLVGAASAQTVSGSVKSARKGQTVRGYVVLRIPKGLHVNSYKPDSKYAIPTRLTVKGYSGSRAFRVTYPPGKIRNFQFSETPISIYEGRVVFGFKVTIPRNYTRKTVRVKADVLFQACTDEVCYAPKTKTIWLTARVR